MIKKILITIFCFSLTGIFAQKVKNDSTLQLIRQWRIDQFGDSIKNPIDTALDFVEIYNPIYRKNISNTWLGYIGSPVQNNDFWNRTSYQNFIFNTPLSPYIKNQQNTVFNNTRKPFSSFHYVMNFNKQIREEVMHFNYTQNINKDINIGLNIDLYSNVGQYASQQTANHILSFFSSCNKKHYFYYFTVNYNNLKRQENGGIKNTNLIESKEIGPSSVSTFFEKSNKAESKNRLFNIYFINGYRFKSVIQKMKGDTSDPANSLNYAIEYNLHKRYYKDAVRFGKYPFYDATSAFNQVNDSSTSHQFKNEAQLILGNFLYLFRLRVAGIYELQSFQHYSSFMPADTGTLFQKLYSADFIQNGSVRVSLSNSYKSPLNWNFTGQNYLVGYQAGDVRYLGNASLRFNDKNDRMVGSINFENNTPAYQLQNYSSSRFSWNNNFVKTTIFHLSGGIVSESYKAKLLVNYGVTSNMIYFNSFAKPVQTSVPINIISVSAEKFFRLWKFRSNTRFLYQFNDRQDVVHIPTYSGIETFYFEHFFRFKATQGTMLFQAGIDFYYNSYYNADAYNPATGLFYLQDTRKIGNYQLYDLFVNVKIKRVSISLKFDHVLHPYLGYNYFTADNYALGVRVIKLGIRWNFYD